MKESVEVVNEGSVTNYLASGTLCFNRTPSTTDVQHVSNDPEDNITLVRTYIRTGQPFVVKVILVWLRARTPGCSRTYLAAINAPSIIVNTVSCTGLENFFLPEVKDSRAMKFKLTALSCK